MSAPGGAPDSRRSSSSSVSPSRRSASTTTSSTRSGTGRAPLTTTTDSARSSGSDRHHDEGEEERRRSHRRGGEDPVRLPEEREDHHEVDEVAPRQSIEHSGQPRAARRRYGRQQRAAARPRTHRVEIDERRAGDRAGHRGRGEPERPPLADRTAPGHAESREDRDVYGVVRPEIEDPSAAGLLELQAGDLAVATVQDRVEEEEDSARDLARQRR